MTIVIVIVILKIIDIVTLEKIRNHLCRYHSFKLPAVSTHRRDTAAIVFISF